MSVPSMPLARLIAEIQATLRPYINHATDCTFGQSNPDGDYCTCGVRAATDKANELAREALREAASPPPTSDEAIGLKQALRFSGFLSEIRAAIGKDADTCTYDELPARVRGLMMTLRASTPPTSPEWERLARHRKTALEAVEQLGAKPGELIQEYRDHQKPLKFDFSRAYAAVCEALTQEGIAAWCGDGTGIVIDMIHVQVQRAEKAEAELAKVRASTPPTDPPTEQRK